MNHPDCVAEAAHDCYLPDTRIQRDAQAVDCDAQKASLSSRLAHTRGDGRPIPIMKSRISYILFSVSVFFTQKVHAAEVDESESNGDLAKAVKTLQGKMEPRGPFVVTSETLIPNTEVAGHRTDTMVVLHTNDIHDILKAPTKGLGGLAYVAGYVKSVRAKRSDVLFVDAGDIQEKGDAMGPLSKGEASYLALGSIGLDVTVPGNHDFIYGLPRLLENTQRAKMPILCAGMFYEDTKETVFPEFLIKRIGGLRVGLIGATVPRSAHSERPVKQLELQLLGQRIESLARKMESDVDVTVLVIHNGTAASQALAKAAPQLDVIVCGHTNEITERPLRTESNALIVTVGRAGQWVGQLDLTVDTERKRVSRYSYVLVPMDHEKVQPDERVAAVIADLDRRWPEPAKSATKSNP